jgi:hypothetical protein
MFYDFHVCIDTMFSFFKSSQSKWTTRPFPAAVIYVGKASGLYLGKIIQHFGKSICVYDYVTYHFFYETKSKSWIPLRIWNSEIIFFLQL